MKQMTPMNRLIKFPDALCHSVSSHRPNRPRGGFVTTTREQLAEIGRAFARGDKRTVDQVCEKLRATSLRRLRNTVSRNSPLDSWKEMKTLITEHIFNSNTCRSLFATCLSALCLIALSTQAATITVTNTNDSGPGSLRQTLAAANDGDTINFGVTGTITLVTGQLLVNKNVIISGSGTNYLAVDANHASRVFYIASGKAVIISRLTIANGSAPFAANGGGINNDHAILTVSECTLTGNSALNGGGIFNDGSAGTATLTVLNSTFSGNTVGAGGGGIFNNGERSGSASLSVNNSTLIGNSTPFDGAGILNDGSGGSATLTITNSTLSGNLATGYGGGICSYGHFGSATVTITDSTVSGNSAGHNGGGIFNDGFGGNAALTVTSSTFSGNDYWGISIEAVQCCATLTIRNTVLNAAAGRANIYNAYGTVTSLGYNLSSDNGGGSLTATGDRINTDPML